MKIYLDTAPTTDFFKLGSFAARLSEGPENWPQELNSELLRQLPFLTDYEINVNLQTVEPQRGFAFGFADVTNKTERPENEHAEAGIPHIRIPLVVMEKAVKPFNVYLDGEQVVPLTEDRIRETLFNPQTFDLSSSLPRDPSLVESMAPPQRGFGMGGQYKTASAEDYFFSSLSKEADMATFMAKATPEMMARGIHGAVSKGKSEVAKHIVSKAEGTAGQRATRWAYADASIGKKFTAPASETTANIRKGRDSVFQKQHSTGPAQEGTKVVKHNDIVEQKPDQRFETTLTSIKHPTGSAPQAAHTSVTQSPVKNQKPTEAHTTISKAPVKEQPKAQAAAPAPQPTHTPPPAPQANPQADANQVVQHGARLFGAAKRYGPKALGVGGVGVAGEEVGRRHEKNKAASVLHAIADTIRESDVEKFVEKVASSPDLQAGFKRAGIGQDLVDIFENTKRASADDRLAAVLDSIEPSVLTFMKLPGGDFLVKSAATKAFAGDKKAKGEVVPKEEAEQAIGPQNAQSMQPGQSATAVVDPVQDVSVPETNAKPIDEFGEWLVQDTMGNNILGWVFPQTVGWDGEFTPQPIALFTNGSAYAFQDSIVGELVGKGATLPVDAPRGDGVFYCIEGRHAVCTAPITIGSAVAGPDGGQQFVGTDVWGNQVHVSITEGLKEPMRVSDVEYALPDTWKFMRLNMQTELVSDPSAMSKTAMARIEGSAATIIYNGGFHIRGGCGLEKLSRDFTHDLDSVGAEFLLGVLGVDGGTSKAKLAEARKFGTVKLAGLKTITTVAERYGEAVKVASALVSQIPNLRRDLIKEASTLDDEGTVNNLLSLNFINPENLHTFINYIPELEKSSEKLAEMWLYSVLGMREVEEEPVARAMKNLEEVIVGLKSIAQAG